jgi:transcriptional regulator with XRE-family HTH domain
MKIVIERLLERRKECKMSKAAVARELRISAPAYQHYEDGYREPLYPTVFMLALVLNTSVGYLTGETDDPSAERIVLSIDEGEEMKRLLSRYRRLPEGSKKAILGILDQMAGM